MSQVVEVDENGTLTLGREVLGNPEPHRRFLVEADSAGIHLRPADEPEHSETAEEWWRKWDALAEEVSAKWNTDKNAVEIISEMRR